MNVPLAAQLFSNSVAVSLTHCKTMGLKEFDGCDATAKFLIAINDLFDILNSRSIRAYGYKKALCFIKVARVQNNLVAIARLQRLSMLNTPRYTGFLGFLACIESAFIQQCVY